MELLGEQLKDLGFDQIHLFTCAGGCVLLQKSTMLARIPIDYVRLGAFRWSIIHACIFARGDLNGISGVETGGIGAGIQGLVVSLLSF